MSLVTGPAAPFTNPSPAGRFFKGIPMPNLLGDLAGQFLSGF
jgi:hypothetical protein